MTKKNQERTCDNCGKSMLGKRKGAKFCSGTCRSNYWLKSKEDKDDTAVSPDLKGVKKDSDNESNEKKLNQGNKLRLTFLKITLKKKEDELAKLKINVAEECIMFATKAGARIGRTTSGDLLGELTGAAFGFLGSVSLMSYFPEQDLKKRAEDIANLEIQIKKLKTEINELEGSSKSSKITLPDFNLKIVKDAKTGEVKKPMNLQIDKIDEKLSIPDINTKAKVIPSKELGKQKYDEFELKGKWLDFIGIPSINFFCVIHGKAGEGKSTFAIQFVSYLATNHSTAIYISGEEGFSKTFKDKFDRLGASSEKLFVGDLKSFKEIEEEVRKNKFHFIVIDSLDTLHMGPEEMSNLRKMRPKNSFITISQSTKDGKMRGSNELQHDCDIVIQIADGKAKTTKNRFLEKGKIFDIF